MNHDQTPRWGNDQTEATPIMPLPNLSGEHDMPLQARPEHQEPEDEEEKDTYTGKKKKRFNRLFKRLFPSIAKKETSTESPRFNMRQESVATPKEVATETTTTAIVEKGAFQNEERSSSLPSQQQMELQPDSVPLESTPEDRLILNDETTPKEAPDIPRAPLEELEQITVVPPELQVPPLEAPPITQPSYEYQPTPPPSTEKNRGVKEAVAGVVAGVFAGDFWRRQRERRYRKRTRNLEANTKKLEEQINEQKKTQTKLKSELTAQRDERQATKTELNKASTPSEHHPSIKKSKTEASPVTLAPAEKQTEAPLHKPYQPASERKGFWGSADNKNTPESSSQVLTPSIEAIEIPEQPPEEEPISAAPIELAPILAKKEASRKTPSIIPERIKHTQEEIEKSNETDFDRHEIMDEASAAKRAPTATSPDLRPATSIAAILQQKTDTRAASVARRPPERPNTTKQPLSSPTGYPKSYQQAAGIGATLGVVIAVTAIIISTTT